MANPVFGQFPPNLTYAACDDYRTNQGKVTLTNFLRDSEIPIKLSPPRPFKGVPKVFDIYFDELSHFYKTEMEFQQDSEFTNYVYHSAVATPSLKVYFDCYLYSGTNTLDPGSTLRYGTLVTSGPTTFEPQVGQLVKQQKVIYSLPFLNSGTPFDPASSKYAKTIDGDYSVARSFMTNIGNNKSNVYLGNSDQTTYAASPLTIFAPYTSVGSTSVIPIAQKNCGIPSMYMNFIRPYYIAAGKAKDNSFIFFDCMRVKADKALTSHALLGKYTILKSDGTKFNFDKCRYYNANDLDSPLYAFWTTGGEFLITDGFFEPIYEFTLDEDIIELISITSSGGNLVVRFVDGDSFDRSLTISDGSITTRSYNTFVLGDPNSPYVVDFFRPVARTTVTGLVKPTESRGVSDEFFTIDSSYSEDQKFITEISGDNGIYAPFSIKVGFVVKGGELHAGFGCIENGVASHDTTGDEFKIGYSHFRIIGSLEHEEINPSDLNMSFVHSLPPNDIIRPTYTELTMIRAWNKKPLGYKHRCRYDTTPAASATRVNVSDFPYDCINQEIVLIGDPYLSTTKFREKSVSSTISKYINCHGVSPITWSLINAPTGANLENADGNTAVLNVPNSHEPFYIKTVDTYCEFTDLCQSDLLVSGAPRVSYMRAKVWPRTLPKSQLAAGTIVSVGSTPPTNFPQHTQALGADQCMLFDLIGTANEDHHIASVDIGDEDVLGVSKGGSSNFVSQSGDLSAPFRLIGKSVGTSSVTFTTITNDITEDEKTLSFDVEVWDVLQNGTGEIPATLSLTETITLQIVGNSSYPHQWAVSDPLVASLLVDPNDSRIAYLRPKKAGTVHFFAMDSAGIPYLSKNIDIS